MKMENSNIAAPRLTVSFVVSEINLGEAPDVVAGRRCGVWSFQIVESRGLPLMLLKSLLVVVSQLFIVLFLIRREAGPGCSRVAGCILRR